MPADMRSLLRLEVPVIVQLASRRMPVEDILALAPGMILELPKRADEELEILVNNTAIGTGTTVKVGGNYGIRVTGMGDARQRLGAMRSDPGADAAAVDARGVAPPEDAG